MKQINFNAQTGETTIVEVPDVEMPIASQEPSVEERVDALEDAMLFII